MRKSNFLKRTFGALALALALMVIFPLSVFAEEAPCESAAAHGHYRHPVTSVIEDSGGESSFALGQSMVDSVTGPDALVETGSDGQLYLTLRFNLMSNISQVSFSIQQPNDASWTPVGYESTAKGADSEDLRFAIPGKDAILRCQLFVDAMGRSVVFYITVDSFAEGNPGNFTRMAADYTPKFTDPGESPQPPQSDIPPVTIPTGSVTNVDKDGKVLGLVIGGRGTETAVPEASVEEDGASISVTISGRVWVMFFVLVFCAQLLACFLFQWLRKLSSGSRKKNSRAIPDADAVNFDDSDDAVLDDTDWMEFDDEKL